MQEWKLLEEHLPDSIYVRVFEERIDLLRAAIVGVRTTPYHNGLFFFDLSFPSNYPTTPPRVKFHSHGLRINPNLYKNGTVCLSLLNTWSGAKVEMWNPTGYTILQLLLSIQALVLNEEPFYNEPGYEKGKGYFSYSKSSENYSNDAFVKSCKIMQYLLRNPPKNFEEFVVEHFRKRAKNILGACKAYMDGDFKVGYYKSDGDRGEKVEVSDGLKKLLSNTYEELVKAFEEHIVGYAHEEELKVEDEAETIVGSHDEELKVEDIESDTIVFGSSHEELIKVEDEEEETSSSEGQVNEQPAKKAKIELVN